MKRVITVCAFLLIATAASAADLVTLNVPLQLSRIHSSIVSATVGCRLFGPHPTTQTDTQYAWKSQIVPLTGGGYSGTITIVFRTEDLNQPGLTDPNMLAAYSCNAGLNDNYGKSYQPYASSTGPALGHAAGTAFNMIINRTPLN